MSKNIVINKNIVIANSVSELPYLQIPSVRRHNCDIQAFLHFMMYLTSQPMYFLKAYDMYYSLMHP